MSAHQLRTHPSSDHFPRALTAFVLAAATGACASMGSIPDIDLRPTIAFENAGNEPVRVFLREIGGGEYLLGNVYPMERATLRVPAHMTLSDARQLFLVVVPMSRYASATLEPSESRSMTSPTVSSLLDIATFRWVATSVTLHYYPGGTVSIVR